MGQLIVPRHTADLDYIHSAIKIYYDTQDWVTTADYKNVLVEYLQKIKKESVRNNDETHYTKCSEIPRYFGFLERMFPGKSNSEVRITDLGRKYYEGVLNKDEDAMLDSIMTALEKVTFGRNNEGVGSDCDYEVPNIVILSSLLLNGISNKEAAYILGRLVDFRDNIASAVLRVEHCRQKGDTSYSSSVTSDIKIIPYLKRIGFFDDDTAIKVSQKAKSRYYSRILNLPILNNLESIGNIVQDNTNSIFNPLIMYGAPGTGKTHKMQKDYISKYLEVNRFVTAFHQSFSYEEFVEGLKPVLNKEGNDVKYMIEKGVFYRACDRAAELAGYTSLLDCLDDSSINRTAKFSKAIAEGKTVLLCIDEVNRGNVASIFGDLISLIEPSKRLGAGELEMTAILPYSKQDFGVPANLVIVGTMNTADRSIQLLDSALRRRFKFEELLPNYDVIKSEKAQIILKGINDRIRCLLNKNYQIGHSYLMFAVNDCDILSALYNKIIPLIEEYFHNDMSKVCFIIGDKVSSEINFYLNDDMAMKAHSSYMSNEIDEEDKKFYTLNTNIKNAIDELDETECGKYLGNLL
jgi:hypothetical protein